ncbi:hypothetical protein NDU88_000114 [Pleurodeles waltl]|uniref:Uncharacterized protein n=1 Tax=Pleurodeles waltl TaxID=8319 RepID=A0AAV7UP26_PLEWA|nr:hypothetical protein NDU88_000114 [Pleurodeles waltl]
MHLHICLAPADRRERHLNFVQLRPAALLRQGRGASRDRHRAIEGPCSSGDLTPLLARQQCDPKDGRAQALAAGRPGAEAALETRRTKSTSAPSERTVSAPQQERRRDLRCGITIGSGGPRWVAESARGPGRPNPTYGPALKMSTAAGVAATRLRGCPGSGPSGVAPGGVEVCLKLRWAEEMGTVPKRVA